MTNVVGVQAMTVAPVSRAFTGIVLSSCRPVSGQECFGPAVAASRVESVSGAVIPAAAASLGLVALGGALVAQHGYADGAQLRRAWEQARPVERQEQVQEQEQAQIQGQAQNDLVQADGDGNDGTFSSIDSTNGTKPMTPWDFRTSSPPG